MDLQLQDKVIIVTGGAKGIGQGITTVLAGEGATTVAAAFEFPFVESLFNTWPNHPSASDS